MNPSGERERDQIEDCGVGTDVRYIVTNFETN